MRGTERARERERERELYIYIYIYIWGWAVNVDFGPAAPAKIAKKNRPCTFEHPSPGVFQFSGRVGWR